MSEISKRISSAMASAKLSYGELSRITGISKSALQRYATGETEKCPLDRITAIANATGVSPAYLMGWETNNSPKVHSAVKIPVLGNVAAGIPIEAVENIIDYEEIPEEMAMTGEFFALRIKGDSMEPKISDGDIVVVRKQDNVDSGNIAIVLVNGDDATCKKFVRHENGVSLVSSNPAYSPMFYTNDEIEKKPVRILGRVVELRAKF